MTMCLFGAKKASIWGDVEEGKQVENKEVKGQVEMCRCKVRDQYSCLRLLDLLRRAT